MTGELYECIRNLLILREKHYPECAFVFFRDGQPILNFRDAWMRACRRARVKSNVFHDLRRSGIRNLVRSGVSETVAMRISGHKTRNVLQRYNITNEEDLNQAAQRLESHLRELQMENPREATPRAQFRAQSGE